MIDTYSYRYYSDLQQEDFERFVKSNKASIDITTRNDKTPKTIKVIALSSNEIVGLIELVNTRLIDLKIINIQLDRDEKYSVMLQGLLSKIEPLAIRNGYSILSVAENTIHKRYLNILLETGFDYADFTFLILENDQKTVLCKKIKSVGTISKSVFHRYYHELNSDNIEHLCSQIYQSEPADYFSEFTNDEWEKIHLFKRLTYFITEWNYTATMSQISHLPIGHYETIEEYIYKVRTEALGLALLTRDEQLILSVNSHLKKIEKYYSELLFFFDHRDSNDIRDDELFYKRMDDLTNNIYSNDSQYMFSFNKYTMNVFKKYYRLFCYYEDGTPINVNFTGYLHDKFKSEYILNGKPTGNDWTFYPDGTPSSFGRIKKWYKNGNIKMQKTEFGVEYYYENGVLEFSIENDNRKFYNKLGKAITMEEYHRLKYNI